MTIFKRRVGSTISAKRIEQEALKDYPNNVIKNFVKHRCDKTGALFITVRWLGHDVAHDTEDSVHNLVEDAPVLIEEYLRLHANEGVCKCIVDRYFK